MNTRKRYRIILMMALIALSGLLIVQVYWFTQAYSLQEKQFDQKVNLALRSVANQLLKLESDSISGIAPVNQVASNSFVVDYNRHIEYPALDSVLKLNFTNFQLLSPFELTVFEQGSSKIAFGNFYKKGVLSSAETTCLEREVPKDTPMSFMLTFTGKSANILGSMWIWISSAFTFLLILVFFGFMLVDLSQQKKFAEVKADFMNNMTHELQTPIANIAIASEVLKTKTNMAADKALHYANIIYDENQRLKNQVEQVLQTAMLEKGEVMLTKSEVDLNAIIEEVMQNFKLRVQRREGKLESNLQAIRPFIYGDAFHLANILYSLLDNADKYSPEAPDITISTRNREGGVLISISDKGMGIRREVQQYIFDKFYRASSGNVHDVKGFGLGLTYVQKIVNAHRGTVSVTSEENNGSNFELYFQNC